MSQELYNQEFYSARHNNTSYAAEKILEILSTIISPIDSAIDLGCGVGTWLHVLKSMGAKQVFGVEGDWVDSQHVLLKESEFSRHNLSNGDFPEVSSRSDLALSLEVAEHLAPTVSEDLITCLTNHSDHVLFSAAIPFQGGQGHINEQWPTGWIERFQKRGYVPLDVVRKRIFNDEKIPFWYRQNVLLFVNSEKVDTLNLPPAIEDHLPAELYASTFTHAANPGVRHSLHYLRQSIRKRFFTRQ